MVSSTKLNFTCIKQKWIMKRYNNCFVFIDCLVSAMDETQPHVGLTPVVTSYATATHPKPHKKMIIDKYIPTIEAAQKIADEALILRVAKTGNCNCDRNLLF